MAFQNIQGGDTIEFFQPCGLSLRGREFKKAKGKANRLLLFAEHVVVNVGGKHGTPYVVDAANFIRISRHAK